jgi:hypothetical protein
MLRVLVYLLPIALAIFALVDCIQTDEAHVRGIPKIGWILLIVLIWVVGPVAWLIGGKDRSQAGGSGAGRSYGIRPSQPSARPMAPDDDPEFLRQLGAGNAEHERMLERWEEDLRRREEEKRETDDGDAGGKS